MDLPIYRISESQLESLNDWMYYDRLVLVEIKFFKRRKRKPAATAQMQLYVPKNWPRIEKYKDLPEEVQAELSAVTDGYLERPEFWLSEEGFTDLVSSDKLTKIEYEFMDDDQLLTSLGGSKNLLPRC